MALTAHRELQTQTEPHREVTHAAHAATAAEHLRQAAYDGTHNAACTKGENKFVEDVRRDLHATIDHAKGLSPEQKKDAEKYMDAIVPKCGKDTGGGDQRAKDLESKYSHDANMSKLLKNMRERAQLSFD